ncbi:MAG: YtxH domain-containing protein [Actinomycetota bacterium]|jgi:gas vesicle protein|nr:YtxH domain-containing protein [Rubrobacter sp.]MDQ3507107.1 YtxH domain-containing protein [Actinomycetota bacterium]
MMLDKQRLRSFLLGGLTGVLAGILLAPKSGKETRGTIADRAGEAREKSRERYFDTQENMRERFSANRDGGSRRGFERSEATVSPGAEDGGPPAEDGGEEVRERPVLRDVSRDIPEDGGGDVGDVGSGGGGDSGDGGGGVGRSEELRRKVRDTRERLRARMDGPVENEPRGGDEE